MLPMVANSTIWPPLYSASITSHYYFTYIDAWGIFGENIRRKFHLPVGLPAFGGRLFRGRIPLKSIPSGSSSWLNAAVTDLMPGAPWNTNVTFIVSPA
jgi:hypothetical protein